MSREASGSQSCRTTVVRKRGVVAVLDATVGSTKLKLGVGHLSLPICSNWFDSCAETDSASYVAYAQAGSSAAATLAKSDATSTVAGIMGNYNGSWRTTWQHVLVPHFLSIPQLV